MTALKHFWRAALVAVFVCGSATASAQTTFAPGREPSAASRLPPNYRQLFAQYIRARNPYVVRDAKITKPYTKWGGIFSGGTFAVVCVAVFRDNPFGILVPEHWIMTVDQGRVKQLAMGMDVAKILGRIRS
jgi:hypothetical protein